MNKVWNAYVLWLCQAAVWAYSKNERTYNFRQQCGGIITTLGVHSYGCTNQEVL